MHPQSKSRGLVALSSRRESPLIVLFFTAPPARQKRYLPKDFCAAAAPSESSSASLFCILRAKSDLLLALGTLRFRIKERRSQRNRWFRCSSQVVLGMGVGAEKQKQNPNVLALLDSLLPPFLESFSNCSRILSIRNKLTTQKQ